MRIKYVGEVRDQYACARNCMKRVKNTSEVREQTREGKQENMFQMRLMTSRNVANACEVRRKHSSPFLFSISGTSSMTLFSFCTPKSTFCTQPIFYSIFLKVGGSFRQNRPN